MRSTEEVSNVLTHPIPSARDMVPDAEGILSTLREHCARQEAARKQISGAAPTAATLVNLMANISQEIQQYQEVSYMGPALQMRPLFLQQPVVMPLELCLHHLSHTIRLLFQICHLLLKFLVAV